MPLLLALWHVLFFSPQGLPLGTSVMPHGGAGSTISFSQAVSNDVGSSLTLNISISPATGHTLVVFMDGGSGGITVTGISDGHGDTFVHQVSSSSGTTAVLEGWTCLAVSAGVSTVTITVGSAQPMSGAVLEYAGVTSIGTNAANFSNTGSTLASVSLTTQDANNWVTAGFGNVNAAFTTAVSGTKRSTFTNLNQGSVFVSPVDNNSATAASVTDSINLPSAHWDAVAVELRTH